MTFLFVLSLPLLTLRFFPSSKCGSASFSSIFETRARRSSYGLLYEYRIGNAAVVRLFVRCNCCFQLVNSVSLSGIQAHLCTRSYNYFTAIALNHVRNRYFRSCLYQSANISRSPFLIWNQFIQYQSRSTCTLSHISRFLINQRHHVETSCLIFHTNILFR